MGTRSLGDYDSDVNEVLRVDGLTAAATQREKLLKAIKLAAEDEFLGSMIGSEPVPTALSDLRALRLRRICEYAGRSLSAHEIAAIFRMSTRQAVRLHDQMESSYPLLAKKWQLAAVQSSATKVVLPVDAPATGKAEIVVMFKRREGPLAADRLVERAGLGARVKVKEDEFQIVIPITSKPEEAHAIVRDTLGLDRLHAAALVEAEGTSGERRGGRTR